MNGPSISAAVRITTITMQRIESPIMNGTTRGIVGLFRWKLDLPLAGRWSRVSHRHSFPSRPDRLKDRPGAHARSPAARAGRRRQPACGQKQRGLCFELSLLEHDPGVQRDDHHDDAERGHDVRPGRVLGPERPERGDVLAPFVERKAVDHGIRLSSACAPSAARRRCSRTAQPLRVPMTSTMNTSEKMSVPIVYTPTRGGAPLCEPFPLSICPYASSSTGAASTSWPSGRTIVSGDTLELGEEVLLELRHVEAFQLDLRGHSEQVQLLQNPAREVAGKESEREERHDPHELPAEGRLDLVDSGRDSRRRKSRPGRLRRSR